jgi:DNA-binding MarR family transcriptional regulator
MFDRIVRNLGTSRSQWWVLAFLSRDDGSPQTNLANELDVGKVALGGLVDRLEAAGMVERRPDPIDRRVKRVFLTRDGRKLVARHKELDKTVNEIISRGISVADLDVTMRTLEIMKTNLLSALSENASGEESLATLTEEVSRKATTRELA